MAQHAVEVHGVSIALACRAFSISQRCYRYEPLLADENEEIEGWLIALAKARKNWGFGLCYLYLRNVQGFKWNHKRVRRIYCELELNLRIKPRKRLKRERPETVVGAKSTQPSVVYGFHGRPAVERKIFQNTEHHR